MRIRKQLLSAALSGLLVSVLALPNAALAAEVAPAPGADCGLPDHWAAQYACDLIRQDVIEAEPAEVDLNGTVTAKGFEALLTRALGTPYGNGSESTITRGEAIAILGKAVGGEALAKADTRVLEGYADAAGADEATRQALAFLLLHGVLQGRDTGKLDLDAPLTMGEAAKLINLAVPEVLPEGTDKISLLLYSDFHGRLEPKDAELGAGRFTTAIAGQLLKNPNTVLLDGGDAFQGTAISNLVKGASVQEWRNKVGVKIATLGNHEFDWDQPTLQGLLKSAEHPVISANIFLTGTENRPDWIAPTATVEVGGYKIGFIGITTEETEGIVLAGNLEGLDIVDPAPVINAEAKKLREEGADLVVVVSHGAASPGADFTVVNEVSNWMSQVTEKVDAITGAHSHERAAGYVLDANGEKVPAIQSGNHGMGLARIDLYINQADKQVTRAVPVQWDPSQMLAPTPWATDLVAKWAAEIEPITKRPIGKLAAPIPRSYSQAGESVLGDFITDGMLTAAPGIQIAVVNGGGIRSKLEASLGEEITWGDFQKVMPFGNTLVTADMTGAELKTLLEQGLTGYIKRLTGQPGGVRPLQVAGITYTWDYAKPDGERIDPADLKLADGTVVDPNTTYKVVVNNFMATGGDGLSILNDVRNDGRQVDVGTVDLDVFVEYFKAQAGDQPFSYEAQNRIQVKNMPEGLQLDEQ